MSYTIYRDVDSMWNTFVLHGKDFRSFDLKIRFKHNLSAETPFDGRLLTQVLKKIQGDKKAYICYIFLKFLEMKSIEMDQRSIFDIIYNSYSDNFERIREMKKWGLHDRNY